MARNARIFQGRPFQSALDAVDYEPDVYVRIGDQAYQRWLKGAQQYAYARGETGFQFIEYYKALMTVRGLPHGFPRAEAFARPTWSRQVRLESLATKG